MLFLKVEEINYLTDAEMVGIISTFSSIHEENFNCNNCKKRMGQIARDDLKGCSKILKSDVANWRNQITFQTCPVNFYSQAFAVYIDLFRHFENGILPFKGGLLEQPNKIMEVFNLIESLKIERSNERQKKQEKMAKKAQEKWRTK